MIVTRTPLRIPIAGGGTDIPSYYREHGGMLVSAAITRYVYVAVFDSLADDRIHLVGPTFESAGHAVELKHGLVRESLLATRSAGGLSILAFSEIPPGTGLGGSASFTVGLLHALYKASGRERAGAELAEDAFRIEHEVLGRPVGKQDQYIVALGGIKQLRIDTSGSVDAATVHLEPRALQGLAANLLMFYTGTARDAASILADQAASFSRNEPTKLEAMHGIKRVGARILDALHRADLREFGRLLGEHWDLKRGLSEQISNASIDRWYEMALHHGALGGKLMGAGGGGFLLVYCEQNRQAQVLRALEHEGLRHVPFQFDFSGTQLIDRWPTEL